MIPIASIFNNIFVFYKIDFGKVMQQRPITWTAFRSYYIDDGNDNNDKITITIAIMMLERGRRLSI